MQKHFLLVKLCDMRRCINGRKIDKLSGFLFLSGKCEVWWFFFLSSFLVCNILNKLNGVISGKASETKPIIKLSLWFASYSSVTCCYGWLCILTWLLKIFLLKKWIYWEAFDTTAISRIQSYCVSSKICIMEFNFFFFSFSQWERNF